MTNQSLDICDWFFFLINSSLIGSSIAKKRNKYKIKYGKNWLSVFLFLLLFIFSFYSFIIAIDAAISEALHTYTSK